MFGERLCILNKGFWYSRCGHCDRIDDNREGGKVIGFLFQYWKFSLFDKRNEERPGGRGSWEALNDIEGGAPL